MKNLKIILLLLLLPIIGYSQNMLTAYYGNNQSVMVEYGKNFQDSYAPQRYGMDIGVGYNFQDSYYKLSWGLHGIWQTHSSWNPIYKLGILLYNNLEQFDFLIGIGIQKNKLHLITKTNLMNTVGINEGGEWLEVGFGLSI